MTKPGPEQTSPAKRTRSPRRRWLVALGLLGVPVLLFLLLTRSAVTVWIVTPVLQSLTGATVSVESATIHLRGAITLRGVRSEAPGVAGPAATFLEVDKLEVAFRWRDLMAGQGVRTVTLLEPKLRLSQSTESQTLNVSALTLLRPTGGSGGAVPTIIIDDAALEIGEHSGSDYIPLSIHYFDASVIPDPAAPKDASTIRIKPLALEGPILGIPGQDIIGRIDNDGIKLTPADVSLASIRPSTVPTTIRKELELLDLSGNLRVRSFTYSFAAGKVEAEVRLNGVAMNLPITPASGEPGGGPLRMGDVNGIVVLRADRIRATLRGTLADLPWTVRLDYAGPSTDAAFTCDLATDGFHVSERPDLLPFAPAIVKERLDGFSQPTATVNSRVRISRDAPTASGPATIRVAGTLDFKDGSAAYSDFPYRFDKLAGSVRFDDDKIELLSITGTAPSGARLEATGLISPINELAAVDVRVHVEGVPVDGALEAALGPERREVISALFSRTRMETLVSRGLVMDPAEASALRAAEAELASLPVRSDDAQRRLDSIRAALAARPVLELGGSANVDVHVTRPEGYLTDWTTDVIVRFDTLGILPEAFPLPIIGDDVRLHITDDHAVLEDGMYHTLRGGLAVVACDVELFAPDGSQDFIPVIDINASRIPVDDLLLHAIPNREAVGENESRVSVREALRGLRIDGAIDVLARIAPRGERDAEGQIQLGYDVHAEAVDLAARPAPGPDATRSLELVDLRGTLTVSERTLDAQMHAALRAALISNPASAEHVGDAKLSLRADFATNDAPSIVEATIERFDASATIEDAIRPFSTAAAERLRSLRSKHQPSGLLDASVDLVVRGETVAGEVAISEARGLAFDALSGRMSLSVPEGRVAVILGTARATTPGQSPTHIRFDDFAAAVDFDGEPMGRVDASGILAIGADEVGMDPAGTDLAIGWSDAPISNRAIGDLVRQRLGDTVADQFSLHAPSGRFDLRLQFKADPASTDELATWGEIRPRFLEITRFDQRIRFPSAGGVISFSPRGGEIRDLTLDAEGTSLRVNGSWTLPKGVAPAVDLNISGWTKADGPTLRAMLPDPLHKLAADSDLTIDGGLRLDRLRLSITGDPREHDAVIRASGAVAVDRLSMQVGTPITDLSGVIQFTAQTEPGSTSFDVGMIADSLRVSNLLVTDARLRVASEPDNPEIIVPLISGSAHGGRFSSRARIGPDPTDPTKRRYFTSLHVAGARFASVMADLTRSAAEDGTSTPDGSRGLLDAELTLEGVVGEADSQVGRGEMAISGGEVLSFPLLLPILQVANLQVPTRERLDLALSSFHLSEGRVTFEEMSVFSRSVELFGYGTMTWPQSDLNLRVVSRGARQLPIVSTVYEAIRNELLSISVRGTLAEPDVSIEQFTSTRGLLKRLIEGSSTERAREMERIRLRAYADQDRVRRSGERIKELSRVGAMEGEN